MRLTVEEVGEAEYQKAERDRAWFKGDRGKARNHAATRGRFAVEQIEYATTPDGLGNAQPDKNFQRFQLDAMMFARMAFRGWRAYRFMVGE